jgi:methionine aminotransferase
VQFALAAFMSRKNEYLELGKKLEKKRDFFKELMSQTKFKPIPSHGSYFQLYSYGEFKNENEIDFAQKLTIEAGVAAIPVSAFYKKSQDNNVLRFCFAKKESTLEEAVKRLKMLR